MNYVADELAADILRRLPVSSVVRFGSVCKSWYSLIRNPNFISSHFQTSQNTQPLQHVLNKYSRLPNGNTSLLFDDGDRFLSECRSLRLQIPGPSRFVRVVGSCNGILCFICFDVFHMRFMLFNPSIRHSFWFPGPRNSRNLFSSDHVGFGFDDDSNDYKILRSGNGSAEIYSFNSNCWRDISVPVPDFEVHNRVGAFVNGALHWVVQIYDENVVIVFDVKTETFQQFSLPLSYAKCSQQKATFNVFEYGGASIAVTLQSGNEPNLETEIFVMKEYGVAKSWGSLATIGKWGKDRYPKVLGFGDKDQAFIWFDLGHFVSLKLNPRVVKNSMAVSELKMVTVHKYVPSLFLLDKQDNTSAWF